MCCTSFRLRRNSPPGFPSDRSGPKTLLTELSDRACALDRIVRRADLGSPAAPPRRTPRSGVQGRGGRTRHVTRNAPDAAPGLIRVVCALVYSAISRGTGSSRSRGTSQACRQHGASLRDATGPTRSDLHGPSLLPARRTALPLPSGPSGSQWSRPPRSPRRRRRGYRSSGA